MAKDRESITLDKDVNSGIHKEAEKRRIGFSTLINIILSEYLENLEKEKR
jgi:hypothetical protein